MLWIDKSSRSQQTFSPEAWKAFTDRVMETADTRYKDKEMAAFIGDALIRQTLGEIAYTGNRLQVAIPVRHILNEDECNQHMYPCRGNPEDFTLEQFDEYRRAAPGAFIKSIVLQQYLENKENNSMQAFKARLDEKDTPEAVRSKAAAYVNEINHLREILSGDSARLMFRNILEQGRRALLEKQAEIDGHGAAARR